MEDNKLHHAGIKGMKWGIRRYQNKDGSLTPAGKKRYGEDVHDDYKKAHTKADVKTLSTKELNDRINRIQKEQQYKEMTRTPKEKAALAVRNATMKIGGQVATNLASKAASYGTKQALIKISSKDPNLYTRFQAMGWI